MQQVKTTIFLFNRLPPSPASVRGFCGLVSLPVLLHVGPFLPGKCFRSASVHFHQFFVTTYIPRLPPSLVLNWEFWRSCISSLL